MSDAATVDASSIKDAARSIIEHLPDDATWADLQYAVYIRESIAAGLADLDAGRVVPVAEVRRRLGLPS